MLTIVLEARRFTYIDVIYKFTLYLLLYIISALSLHSKSYLYTTSHELLLQLFRVRLLLQDYQRHQNDHQPRARTNSALVLFNSASNSATLRTVAVLPALAQTNR